MFMTMQFVSQCGEHWLYKKICHGSAWICPHGSAWSSSKRWKLVSTWKHYTHVHRYSLLLGLGFFNNCCSNTHNENTTHSLLVHTKRRVYVLLHTFHFPLGGLLVCGEALVFLFCFFFFRTTFWRSDSESIRPYTL